MPYSLVIGYGTVSLPSLEGGLGADSYASI